MNRKSNRWPLVIYDLVIMLALDLLMVLFYVTTKALSWQSVVLHGIVSAVCVFTARYLGKIYQQIWRYGGIQCYIRLLVTDAAAFVAELLVEWSLAHALGVQAVSFARLLSLACMNLLAALAMRMVYRYAFKCGKEDTRQSRVPIKQYLQKFPKWGRFGVTSVTPFLLLPVHPEGCTPARRT